MASPALSGNAASAGAQGLLAALRDEVHLFLCEVRHNPKVSKRPKPVSPDSPIPPTLFSATEDCTPHTLLRCCNPHATVAILPLLLLSHAPSCLLRTLTTLPPAKADLKFKLTAKLSAIGMRASQRNYAPPSPSLPKHAIPPHMGKHIPNSAQVRSSLQSY
jgi:hypothetical protein